LPDSKASIYQPADKLRIFRYNLISSSQQNTGAVNLLASGGLNPASFGYQLILLCPAFKETQVFSQSDCL